jgi:cation transport ATPase
VVSSDAGARESEAREAERVRASRRLAIAAGLTIPVVILEMGTHFVPAIHDLVMATIGMGGNWLVQFALVTVILFGPGWCSSARGSRHSPAAPRT